jgi:mycoredoxin
MTDRVPTSGVSERPAPSGEPSDAPIVMYTTSWCPDCRRAKRVFSQLGMPYTEVNIDEAPEAAEYVIRVNRGSRSVPTIVFPDGSILVEPRSSALEAKLRSL